MVIGDFTSQPAGHTEMNVKVTDPAQSVLFTKNHAQDGKFAFTAPRDGEYLVCFENIGTYAFVDRDLSQFLQIQIFK
jgi:hypothetical protein